MDVLEVDLSQRRTLYAQFLAAAKSLQFCPILCNPIDGSPPGSPVPGILQARILEFLREGLFFQVDFEKKIA